MIGQPPRRARQDIITAHQLLQGIVNNSLFQVPPTNAMGSLNIDLNSMTQRLDVLCWCLHHDSNTSFRDYLDTYERQLKAFTGQELIWSDKREFHGPFIGGTGQ